VLGGFIRLINVRADQEALDHSRQPDGLASSLVADWNGRDVDPGALEALVLYTHPPLTGRIRHAMDWKAAHPGT
jgi:STE24 endopeptidase